MKRFRNFLVPALALGWALLPTGVLGCDQERDGCLGCTDEELPACLTAFVRRVCEISGDPANCNTQRAYDDAERYVLTSTGNHMSRMYALTRSSSKYRLHH